MFHSTIAGCDKINKPVPRRRPKMQITMGKWDKQGQKEAQNPQKRVGGGHRKDIDLIKNDHHTSTSRSCFADLKENYQSEWKMTLGTSTYPLELFVVGPKMQNTMGKWDKLLTKMCKEIRKHKKCNNNVKKRVPGKWWEGGSPGQGNPERPGTHRHPKHEREVGGWGGHRKA